MKFRDVQLLSAYLDGQLSPSDAQRLESRLDSDPQLRAVMDDLRAARDLLRKLPQRRAPRNFTLTPKMAGLKPPAPRAYPTLRLAAVLATFFFVVTFAVDGLAPLAAQPAAMPMQAIGRGGGGGGPGAAESAPAATQAPAATKAPAATEAPVQPFAAVVPTTTPEAPASQNDQTLQAPEAPSAKGVAPPSENSQPSRVRSEPVPLIWLILLGVVALICGGAALLLRLFNERKFRERWKRK